MKQIFLTVIVAVVLIGCEKHKNNVSVVYRITDFENGCIVKYRVGSDTLIQESVTGTYTLSTPWKCSFQAEPGEIVYLNVTDTTENSFSKIQILLDGKVYKEKSRTDDRFMPMTISGVIPFE